MQLLLTIGAWSYTKMNYKFFIFPKRHPFSAVWSVPALLLLGLLAGYAQTGTYLFTGSETTITLNPGTYNITAYGAQGGATGNASWGVGALGAEMSGDFSFSGLTTLTLLVGGAGQNAAGNGGGGGGGGSFVVESSIPLSLVIAGGGGGGGVYAGNNGGAGLTGTSGGNGNGFAAGGGGTGGNGGGGSGADGGGGLLSAGGWGNTCPVPPDQSFLGGGGGGAGYQYKGNGGYGCGGGGGAYGGGGGGGYSGGGGGGNSGGGGGGGSCIDLSAIAVLAEVSGIASPDGSPNGEIIITLIPEPTTCSLLALGALAGLCLLRRKQN